MRSSRVLPPLLLVQVLLLPAACSGEGGSGPAGTGDGDVAGGSGDSGGGGDVSDATPGDIGTEIGNQPTDAADAGEEVAAEADFAADVTEDLAPADLAMDVSPVDASTDLSPVDAGTDISPVDMGLPPDPYGTGPYGSTTYEERISLPGGMFGRNIDLAIWVPTGMSGPAPIVVMNHGFQLSGDNYAQYAERAVTHGLVMVLPSYNDSMIAPLTHTQLADDVSTILDHLAESAATPGSRLNGKADLTRIGVGGHSRGGKQSILAATQDDRIVASFNLDPVDSGPPFGSNPTDYPSVTPERMGGFTIPGGFMGGGMGGGTMGMDCAPEAENFHQYYLAASGSAYEYVIPDAGHLDFTDSCGLICATCQSGSDRSRVHEIAIATLIAFYRVELAGDLRYATYVNGAEITSMAPEVQFASR